MSKCYQDRKSLLFSCMLFSWVVFSSTSTFLAWAILYLWENVLTWISQLKFTADSKENYQKRKSSSVSSSSPFWGWHTTCRHLPLYLAGSAFLLCFLALIHRPCPALCWNDDFPAMSIFLCFSCVLSLTKKQEAQSFRAVSSLQSGC